MAQRQVLRQLSRHLLREAGDQTVRTGLPAESARHRELSAAAAAAAAATTAAPAGSSVAAHGRALDALFGEDTAAPPGATVEQLTDRGFGVRVRGIADVRALTAPQIRWLLQLLFRHRLLAVAGQQHLRPPEFAEFARHFGHHPEWEVFYKGTTGSGGRKKSLVPGHPEVLCVTSLGPGSYRYAEELGPPYLSYDLQQSAAQRDPSFVANFQWHTDNSYEEKRKQSERAAALPSRYLPLCKCLSRVDSFRFLTADGCVRFLFRVCCKRRTLSVRVRSCLRDNALRQQAA